jgi:hypothetical protein
MARPRKNRTGDHAQQFAEALAERLASVVREAVTAEQRVYRAELTKLRAELRTLSRRVEALARRRGPARTRLGRWVPGGPGRPPKDATARIAAYAARTKKKAPRKAASSKRAKKAPG